MSTKERKELFTYKVRADSRTYFFDVRETKGGTRYMVISESRQIGSRYDHSRVMIFQEHIEMFAEGFQKTLQFLGSKSKAYNVKNMRQAHPKAYERWTLDEDFLLRKKYLEGVGIAKLASLFQRKPSAIRSRLAKLGLLSMQGTQAT